MSDTLKNNYLQNRFTAGTGEEAKEEKNLKSPAANQRLWDSSTDEFDNTLDAVCRPHNSDTLVPNYFKVK